jgi:hypothetical protein
MKLSKLIWWRQPVTHDALIAHFAKEKAKTRMSLYKTVTQEAVQLFEKPHVQVKANYDYFGTVEDDLQMTSRLSVSTFVELNPTSPVGNMTEQYFDLSRAYRNAAAYSSPDHTQTFAQMEEGVVEIMRTHTHRQVEHSMLLSYVNTQPIDSEDQVIEIGMKDHDKPLFQIETRLETNGFADKQATYESLDLEAMSAFDLQGNPCDKRRVNWLPHDPTVSLLETYKDQFAKLKEKPCMKQSINLAMAMFELGAQYNHD